MLTVLNGMENCDFFPSNVVKANRWSWLAKLLHFVLQWTGATDTKIRLQLKLPTQTCFWINKLNMSEQETNKTWLQLHVKYDL